MFEERSIKDIRRVYESPEHPNRCPQCMRDALVTEADAGEKHCASCGFVVAEKMVEMGPEWRAFAGEENADRNRAGPPESIVMRDFGLATVIGKGNVDASGRRLSGAMRSTIERLRTWDNRSQAHESKDRNLGQAMSELRRLADKLHLSYSVVEKAAYIYRKVLDRRLVRGRSILGMTAASLYAACRETGTPRTLKDIAYANNMKKKDIARDYRLLIRELDIRLPVQDPRNCVPKVANGAGISEKTKRRALEIIEEAKEKSETFGKDPMGFAASALYLACTLEGEYKTQKDVADAAGVTEVTVRNRYKGLRDRVLGYKPGEVDISNTVLRSKDIDAEKRKVPEVEMERAQNLMREKLRDVERESGARPEMETRKGANRRKVTG